MKKILLLIFSGLICTNMFARVLSDSFEKGVPPHIKLQGNGKLGISPWHYKHGKQSLQWDWRQGDYIRINNSLGNLNARGGYGKDYIASFGIWIYMTKPLADFLVFEFREGNSKSAKFKVSLNFKGWQPVYVNYKNFSGPIKFSRPVSSRTDNILIKAPAKFKQGRIFIDLIVYNGIWDPRRVQAPRQTPFTITEINSEKYPSKDLSTKEISGLKKAEKIINSYCTPEYPKTFNIAAKADEIFNKYHIIKDAKGIRGEGIILERGVTAYATNSIFYTLNGIKISRRKNYLETYIRDLETMSGLYYHAGSEELKKKTGRYFALMNEHLFDQGFNKYLGIKTFPYTIGLYGEVIITMAKVLKKYNLLDDSLAYVLCDNDIFGKTDFQKFNMDYFYHNALKSFALAMLLPDMREQARAFYFLRDKLSRQILIADKPNGFKADGSGYHHMRYYPGYMRNALRSIAKVTYALGDTPFQISTPAFGRIKQAVLNLRFCVNKRDWPLGLKGRHPELNYVIRIPYDLVRSKVNGKIDPELAAAYLRFHSSSELGRLGFKAECPPQGALAMPYAGILAFRRDDWLALAQGYGKYYYSTEINAGKNRFGRYTTNGTLDIIGPGGLVKSGTSLKGWDWNRMNGATVIYYPEEKLRPKVSGTECLFTPYGFFGGISWRGQNGCFVMKIYGEPYECSFRGRKSYFMIDNRIIALGSDISNDEARYPTETNLFQKALFKKDKPVFIDGSECSAFPMEKQLPCDEAHYLLDSVGNGYYVASGQKLFVARKHQKKRNSRDTAYAEGDFATAWLSHGFKPSSAGYEYVILPYCGAVKLAEFARLTQKGKAYKVLRKNKSAHIVHDLISDIYGAVFFSEQRVEDMEPLIQVDRNCLVMFKQDGARLKVAAGDPNVNRPGRRWRWGASKLKPLRLTFAGKWRLMKPVPGVKIISNDKAETVVECACVNGKSFNFDLRAASDKKEEK